MKDLRKLVEGELVLYIEDGETVMETMRHVEDTVFCVDIHLEGLMDVRQGMFEPEIARGLKTERTNAMYYVAKEAARYGIAVRNMHYQYYPLSEYLPEEINIFLDNPTLVTLQWFGNDSEKVLTKQRRNNAKS